MLHILLGEDVFSLQRALDEIKKSLGDQDSLATNTTVLDGQEVTLDQLRTVCETIPFLAEKRLVIVKGLLEHFEPKGKSSRHKETTRPGSQQSEDKLFGTFLSRLPESTVLVLTGGRIRGDNPLLRELSGKAKVRFFPLLSEAKLRPWIQRRVSEEGGSISPQGIGLLAKLIGSDLWAMSMEIGKLVSYASGRRIEEEDVKVVTSYAAQANVFALTDAILESKTALAEQLLEQLRQRGAAPAYLLVMLSRQVQLMFRAKTLKEKGKSIAAIQNKLGLTSEYVLQKTLEQADRYPLERLKRMYHQLLETDLSLKTGRYDGDLALSILVAELSQKKQAAPQPYR